MLLFSMALHAAAVPGASIPAHTDKQHSAPAVLTAPPVRHYINRPWRSTNITLPNIRHGLSLEKDAQPPEKVQTYDGEVANEGAKSTKTNRGMSRYKSVTDQVVLSYPSYLFRPQCEIGPGWEKRARNRARVSAWCWRWWSCVCWGCSEVSASFLLFSPLPKSRITCSDTERSCWAAARERGGSREVLKGERHSWELRRRERAQEREWERCNQSQSTRVSGYSLPK